MIEAALFRGSLSVPHQRILTEAVFQVRLLFKADKAAI